MSWGAVIVGGAALTSAVVGSKSSDKAADASSAASGSAIRLICRFQLLKRNMTTAG